MNPFCCAYTPVSILKYGNIAYAICRASHVRLSQTDVTPPVVQMSPVSEEDAESKRQILCFISFL